jgi:hypothetical protein
VRISRDVSVPAQGCPRPRDLLVNRIEDKARRSPFTVALPIRWCASRPTAVRAASAAGSGFCGNTSCEILPTIIGDKGTGVQRLMGLFGRRARPSTSR